MDGCMDVHSYPGFIVNPPAHQPFPQNIFLNRSYVIAGMDMVARAKQASRSTPMVVNLSLGSSFR